MGMRDREIQAISSALADRIVAAAGGGFDAIGMIMREGPPDWTWAQFRSHDGKVKSGYVVVYFGGVGWVTSRSLASSTERWGQDDFVIPIDAIEHAAVSLPGPDAYAPQVHSWTRVRVLSPGAATLHVGANGGVYSFTHLESPLAVGVAANLDTLLTARP